MTELCTTRLRLRPLGRDDLQLIVRIHTDPELMRHIHAGAPHRVEECAAHHAEALDDWSVRAAGPFVVELITGEVETNALDWR